MKIFSRSRPSKFCFQHDSYPRQWRWKVEVYSDFGDIDDDNADDDAINGVVKVEVVGLLLIMPTWMKMMMMEEEEKEQEEEQQEEEQEEEENYENHNKDPNSCNDRHI